MIPLKKLLLEECEMEKTKHYLTFWKALFFPF